MEGTGSPDIQEGRRDYIPFVDIYIAAYKNFLKLCSYIKLTKLSFKEGD